MTAIPAAYEDTKRLFEYGFTQIESITPESLYAEDPRVIDITGFDTSDAQHGELTLGIRAVDDTKDMTIVGRKDNIDFLRENFGQVSSIRWTREFRAPINVGDVMGILTFYSENKGTAEYELVATRFHRRPRGRAADAGADRSLYRAGGKPVGRASRGICSCRRD